MKKRIAFRIQLTVPAKAELTKISDHLGITQIHMASRISEWFADQTPELQALILGLIPPSIEQDTAKLVLEKRRHAK